MLTPLLAHGVAGSARRLTRPMIGPGRWHGVRDAHGRMVTATAATTVVRLPRARQRLLRREAFTESSRAAAGWHRARRWAARHINGEATRRRRNDGTPTLVGGGDLWVELHQGEEAGANR
jgi:hypothetical protein